VTARQQLTFLYGGLRHSVPLPPLDVGIGKLVRVLQVEPLEEPVPAPEESPGKPPIRHHEDRRTAELGRLGRLSTLAVSERLARLEEAGAITGYRAELDPRARLHAQRGVADPARAARDSRRFAEPAQRTSEVVECHRITGDDCYFMRM
jgi:hypothetical protein